ncbi:MAG: 2-iminoacetate synthase ThiH [Marinifilaceae bacterium]|jgi:2-iminoacetate synthase|nr:2-iminoacetate synthase ThiH [Marinifilaceae bacterium]
MKKSFYDILKSHDWNEMTKSIYSKRDEDVEKALSKTSLNLEDFKALISPSAEKYLAQMIEKSMYLSQKRFGKTIQFYIPLYLSNSCNNNCVYCGFNHSNKFDRTILNTNQAIEEANVIKKMGFEHILLVTGEDSKNCGVNYLKDIMSELKKIFAHISIEVQPMETDEYMSLVKENLNTVYVYQETYREETYKSYHPKGKKSNFKYRLETPDRLGIAGVHKIGIGCLLGLEDWRTDSFCTAMHLDYLERNYWKTKYSLSFPRLRPHAGSFQPNHKTNQRNLVQLICAYRLFKESVEISLSTREEASFRDKMIKYGVTSYSAGSKTNPGGYTEDTNSLEQFSVDDSRTPEEIETAIKNTGYEVIWKDWDSFMQTL